MTSYEPFKPMSPSSGFAPVKMLLRRFKGAIHWHAHPSQALCPYPIPYMHICLSFRVGEPLYMRACSAFKSWRPRFPCQQPEAALHAMHSLRTGIGTHPETASDALGRRAGTATLRLPCVSVGVRVCVCMPISFRLLVWVSSLAAGQMPGPLRTAAASDNMIQAVRPG